MSKQDGLLVDGFPRFLHGGDYNPDQWLDQPEIIDEDFRLLKLSGCNTLSVGIFAWAALEPQDGRFAFDWLGKILDRIHQAGARAVLAAYGEQFYAGQPVITEHRYGKGRAFYVGSNGGMGLWRELLGNVARQLGIPTALPSPLPASHPLAL